MQNNRFLQAMKYNYTLILLLLIILSGCFSDDESISSSNYIAQFTFTEIRESGSSTQKNSFQLNPIYEEELLLQINTAINIELCTSFNNEISCDKNSFEESNHFSFIDSHLNSYELETWYDSPFVSTQFENGRLQTMREQINDDHFITTYSYTDNKVTEIDFRRVGNPDPLWVKTMEYEGNNLIRIQFNLVNSQQRQEWLFTYDNSINPFYENDAWLLTMKLGMTNWQQPITLSKEALVYSENNVSTLTINYPGPSGTIPETYTFERSYDASNLPVETNITSDRSSLEWQQAYSYQE